MKRAILKAAILGVVASCATAPARAPAAPTTSTPTPSPADDAGRAPPVAAIELPVPPASSGDGREVHKLLDSPTVELVTITLRHGTVLPSHSAPVPVTIQTLSGAGAIWIGAQHLPLDPAHMVVLAAHTVHEVHPEPGPDLVLLVHHLRGGAGGAP